MLINNLIDSVDAGQIINSDVCIVGAGAAGITIARELNGLSMEVCLLESGGLLFDAAPQSLYRGTITGKSYSLETSRLRMFGGTTNHWGGECRPFEEIDFEQRDWVNNSGWPFSASILAPYYTRAKAHLTIDPRGHTVGEWRSESMTSLPLDESSLITRITQFSGSTEFSEEGQFRATPFGEKYLEELTRSMNVRVYLNSNAVEIISDDSGSRVAEIRCLGLAGNHFAIRARVYILSLGGIENARLLLNSDRLHENGLGNDHDLVGRYFMDNPGTGLGHLILSDSQIRRMELYAKPSRRLGTNRAQVKGYVTPTPAKQKELRLSNCCFVLARLGLPIAHQSRGYNSLKSIVGDVRYGVLPQDFFEHLRNVITGFDDIGRAVSWKVFSDGDPVPIYRVKAQFEQEPNPDSRVTLNRTTDVLGMRTVNLHWKLGELDLRTIRGLARLIGLEFGKRSIGRMMLGLPENDAELTARLGSAWHHIGTTRMHREARFGVVDADCRVHNVRNLYVAGSSVFPTSGNSVPTFTIVALAVRLADHIKNTLPNS